MGLVSSIFLKLSETLGDIKGDRAACIANVIIENDQETEEKYIENSSPMSLVISSGL